MLADQSSLMSIAGRDFQAGSPVFVCRAVGSHFIPSSRPTTVLMNPGHYIVLLVIHYGQFPERWELKDAAWRAAAAHEAKHYYGWQICFWFEWNDVRDPVGVYWRSRYELSEIARNAQIARGTNYPGRSRPPSGTPVAEVASAEAPISDENPQHKEDFTRLVSAASKPKPEGGRT